MSEQNRLSAEKAAERNQNNHSAAYDMSSSGTPYLREIIHLAWPTMAEQFLQTAVQYADTAMVGTLGTMAVAAVGATSTINWLINGTLSGAAVGFLALASQALGARDFHKVRAVSAQSVLVVICFGILLSAFCLGFSGQIPLWMQADSAIAASASSYFFILSLPLIFRCATAFFGTLLRAVQDTKTPMYAGLLANLLNIILNLFFIYPKVPLPGLPVFLPGLGLGINGAALASAIAFAAGGSFLSWKIWNHPDLSFRGASLKPDWKLLKECTRISLPGIGQRFATSMGYVAFASMINSTGQISTAAHTLANTVESAFYIPGWGMQAAIAALCGHALGAGQGSRIRDLKFTALKLEVVLMFFSGLLLFLLAPSFMRFFSDDVQVIHLGSTVLKMVAISEPFYGVPIILEGMMMGMGQTMIPFWFNISGMWLVRIVGTWFCTQMLNMGLIAAWACMILHNLYLFVIFVWYDRTHPLQEQIEESDNNFPV